MGIGSACGKVILFGEHFVVHGAPAIAASLNRKAVVEVAVSDSNDIITEQTVVPEMSRNAIAAILESMEIDKKFNVYLSGDLPTFGGLGSSAAFSVALVRALSDEFSLNLTCDEINRHAYAGEKTFHGNPSGIDNHMATYGGLKSFRRSENGNIIKPIPLDRKLHLVVSFTGKFSNTVAMVDSVKRYANDSSDSFKKLFDDYIELELQAEGALEKGDIKAIGNFMNANHILLSEIGLSIEENDRIVETALKAGALGSKITGGGGGGCCISLAKDEMMAHSICRHLDFGGFPSFYSVVV